MQAASTATRHVRPATVSASAFIRFVLERDGVALRGQQQRSPRLHEAHLVLPSRYGGFGQVGKVKRRADDNPHRRLDGDDRRLQQLGSSRRLVHRARREESVSVGGVVSRRRRLAALQRPACGRHWRWSMGSVWRRRGESLGTDGHLAVGPREHVPRASRDCGREARESWLGQWRSGRGGRGLP